jgi:sugar/nucleoside kinase (ribokinase family)
LISLALEQTRPGAWPTCPGIGRPTDGQRHGAAERCRVPVAATIGYRVADKEALVPFDVYAYGMVAPSTLLLLEGAFPAPNAYAEVDRTLFNVAGEAVAGAWVLARLGYSVRLAGRWLADSSTSDELVTFLSKAGIDCGRLSKRAEYHPIEELVISDGHTRTIFGSYVKILFREKQWDAPLEDDIRDARVVLLDPFLRAESELGAELCARHRVPYVSIDVSPKSVIAKNAAALIVSEEHLLRDFPDRATWPEVFDEYATRCPGLVAFTFGADDLWYALPGVGQRERRLMSPFRVNVKDTTGAGDSFRAAVAFGMLQGFDWERCLRVACALAGLVCERFPGVLESPTRAELSTFLTAHEQEPL